MNEPDIAGLIEEAIKASKHRVLIPSSYGSPETAAAYQSQWERDFLNAEPSNGRLDCDDPFRESPRWRR